MRKSTKLKLENVIRRLIREVASLQPGKWASDDQIDSVILSKGGTDDDVTEWRELVDYGDPSDPSDKAMYVREANNFLRKYGIQVSSVRDMTDYLSWKISKVE